MEFRPRLPVEFILTLVILLIGIPALVGCASATASHAPLITDLSADKDIVLPSQSCGVTCVASGLEDSSLIYQWVANGGSISGEGSTVTWTAPDILGTYTITAAVTDGNGSQSTSYLTIDVVTNNPPVIDSLVPDETTLAISESSDIECVASDQDGDDLQYEWSASGGGISGEGTIVTWTAPDAVDTYTITVVVTDGNGGKVTNSLEISVLANNNPPSIKEFITTTKIGGLRDNGNVLKDKYYYIECIASDPDGDELSYDWWVSDGEILYRNEAILPETLPHYIPKIKERSMILWHAPDYGCKAIIEVVVKDERGDDDDEDMVLKVVLTTCQLYGS